MYPNDRSSDQQYGHAAREGFHHLEHGGQRFNQQRRLDGAARRLKRSSA